MKITRMLKGIAAGGATLLILGLIPLRPAKALFGIGDIVFDPSVYAAVGQIWASNASMLAKMIEEYNQIVKIYSVNMQTYNQALSMATRFTHLDHQFWITQGMSRVNDYTQNKYGETIAWHGLVNGNPSVAAGAWGNASLELKDNPSLAQTASAKSALASVEVIDGTNTRCLQVIAQYRQNVSANEQQIQALQNSFNGANSQMQQLEVMNAANAQAANESRAQGELQACLSEQQAESAKVTRDQITETLNFNTQKQGLAATTNVAMGGISQVANRSWMQ
jgi:type IV secretion system protein TrbJ